MSNNTQRKAMRGSIKKAVKEQGTAVTTSITTSDLFGNDIANDNNILKYNTENLLTFIPYIISSEFGGYLIYSNDAFRHYDGKKWVYLSDDTVQGIIQRKLLGITGLSQYEINNIIVGVRKTCSISEKPHNSWVDSEELATYILPVDNGLLNLEPLLHGKDPILLEHTPNLYNTTCAHFVYNPDEEPTFLQSFLDEVLPDKTAQMVLQEFVGLCLTYDTTAQKMLCTVGASRSGKGTYSRLLHILFGADNCADMTMSSMAGQFALSSLVNKRACFFNDAQDATPQLRGTLKENILTIVGEDRLSIDRKYKNTWDGTLYARLIMICNKIPSFTDSSNALANRMIIVPFLESFADKEDTELTKKLCANPSAALNWAIEGLRRYYSNNRFTECISGKEYLDEYKGVSNLTLSFIQEECKYPVPDGFSISKDIYNIYKGFMESRGCNPMSNARFFQDLRANAPKISKKQKRINGKQEYLYQGIVLNKDILFSDQNIKD